MVPKVIGTPTSLPCGASGSRRLEVASVYPLATSAAQQASVRLGPSKPRVGPIAPHACGGLG